MVISIVLYVETGLVPVKRINLKNHQRHAPSVVRHLASANQSHVLFVVIFHVRAKGPERIWLTSNFRMAGSCLLKQSGNRRFSMVINSSALRNIWTYFLAEYPPSSQVLMTFVKDGLTQRHVRNCYKHWMKQELQRKSCNSWKICWRWRNATCLMCWSISPITLHLLRGQSEWNLWRNTM